MFLIFGQAEEGEEDDEMRDLFKGGKKKKKNEKSAAEIAELVETLMAELEVVAEEDAVLNTQGKPAINKLRKLPLLTQALSKYDHFSSLPVHQCLFSTEVK